MIGWSAAALLLATPLVAMQFTNEVNWGLGDFLVFAAMLLGVGLVFEFVVKTSRDRVYRWATALALLAAFLLAWLSLGVGIIGKDGDPANLMYAGVLAVAVIGTLIARMQASKMTWVLLATALAQALVALIAVGKGLGMPYSSTSQLLTLNGFFVALFVGSAWLFHTAKR